MVDDFGGTDSDQGVYGPVGPETGSPGPNPNQGPPGPPGPNIDRWAATRIVSQNPDEGTDLTIQDAIDNLPAEGGTIFVKQGTYQITTTILLPDKPVMIVGAGWSTILSMPSFAGPLFQVPDGLSEVRRYVLRDISVIGSGVTGQTFWAFNDVNGRGDCLASNLKVTGFQTFVDWLQYNTNYDRQSNFWIYDSHVEPIVGNSILAKTPNPAGSYFAPVAIRAYNTRLSAIVDTDTVYGWAADADCDLWVSKGQNVTIVAGFKFNGLMANGTFFALIGAGDYTFNGNGSDVYDFVDDQCAFTGRTSVYSTFAFADTRLIFKVPAAKIHPSVIYSVAIRLEGQYASFECAGMADGIGLTHPGVDLIAANATVESTAFLKIGAPGTVFPQGCIKISGVAFCKIHDNDFATTVTGKTVLEVAPGDSNLVHDNTGAVTSGTGITLVGAVTIAQAHNNT